MNTKNILKTMALAMLLVTACNKVEIADNEKGYTVPVTITATREGDEPATRATYNGSTRKLEFSTGDKLFVIGEHTTAGSFAGTLDYVSAGTFRGTITTQNEYSGTVNELLEENAQATLLPAGYEGYGYLSVAGSGYGAYYTNAPAKAFALTKAAAVEQFSLEHAEEYSSGFALAPTNAILNFTVTDLTASTEVAVAFTDGYSNISGDVTTDGSGTATFAIALSKNSDLEDWTLTVGGKTITLVRTEKILAAGKIYNVNKSAVSVPEGAISGNYTINGESGAKVYFSKGNLRYASSAWSFFDNQYDYYTSFDGTNWDRFGFSTSSTDYGMNTSQDARDYPGDFVDWGNNSSLQEALGTGWRTLSRLEWTYVFSEREVNGGSGNGYSYTLGQRVNGVLGVVLYPDDYTGAVYAGSDWATFEAAGCVFLPAAGFRDGNDLPDFSIGIDGYYRSSDMGDEYSAAVVHFRSNSVSHAETPARDLGCSVRLVHPVE